MSGASPQARDLPRVVAVGFNKCGTRSLAELFRAAGHPIIHQKVKGRLRGPRKIGLIMQRNLAANRPVFEGVEGYVFYCDLIYSTPERSYDGNTAFREILRDYPDTILLLNTRDREGWIRSRLGHGHGEFARREMQARGLDSIAALTDVWRAEWDAQHAEVREFMRDRPEQLVEFDLDHDSAEDLAERLPAYGLNPEDLQDIGRSRGRRLGRLTRALKRLVAHYRPRRHD